MRKGIEHCLMKECYECGSKINIERHHIDFDPKNNHPSNFLWLCQRCHTEVNQSGITEREELDRVREQVKAREPGRFAKLPLFPDL